MAYWKKHTNSASAWYSDMQRFIYVILFIILSSIICAGTAPAPPDIPEIQGMSGHEKITITWNKKAESSIDPLTGYSDFEGYRLYRSTDGGVTWGKSWNRIYNHAGNQVGWKPLAQFDLNEVSDSLHCTFSNGYHDTAEKEFCYSKGYPFHSVDPAVLEEEDGNIDK
jgi:hypothetical protein